MRRFESLSSADQKMHNQVLTLFCCCLISTVYVGAKLPSNFKKCDRNESGFKQCIVRSVEDAVGQLTHPFKEVGLPSIEPLSIPSMTIAPGSGPTNFQQNYKDIKLSGLTKAKFSKFDLDFDKKTVIMECTVPQVIMDFQYDIKGKVLVLPFFGKGPGVISLDNLKFTFNYGLEEYEKNGNTHYKIVSSKLAMAPKSIHFKLDNLFNGDENLGKNINLVFNENWEAIFGDVQSSYEEAFDQIFTSIFNNFLTKVPISEFL